MKGRLVLGPLFYAWLYGTPFLLIVGLIRRTGAGYFATQDAAEQFSAVTDRYLIAGIVLNLAVPVIGGVVALLANDAYWRVHFGLAVVGMIVVMLSYAVVRAQASAPVVGTVPAYHGPATRYTGCVTFSGGTNTCPGG